MTSVQEIKDRLVALRVASGSVTMTPELVAQFNAEFPGLTARQTFALIKDTSPQVRADLES
jgi:hypothetical protein